MTAKRDYTEDILETMREPLLVLSGDLRVKYANRAFYAAFGVHGSETVGRHLFELGNHQWDIPRLRELLERILQERTAFNDFEVEHDFESIGRRTMLLNARRIESENLILLAIEDISARKQAEKMMSEKEHHYRETIGQVKDHAIFTTDTHGRATSWNEGVQRILGFDEEDFIGQDITRAIFTPEAQADGVPEWELQTAAKTGTANDDRWMRRKDGSHFYASGITTALRDAAGTLVGFIKVMRDTTKRRQDEIALRDTKAALEFTLEAGQLGDWDLDLIHGTSRRSLRHDQCFGYDKAIPESEWSHERFLEHVHPEDRANVEQQFREAVSGLKDWHSECRVIWPDGSMHWIAVHGNVYRVENGKGTRMLGIVADITGRKQAEEARARLASIVESSSDAIVGKDMHSIILSWNAGAERLFGYTAREAIGQPITMLIPDERIAEEEDILNRIRRGEHVEHYETVRCRKDGTSLDVSLTVSPILDEQGKVVGASKIARDITEQKKAEKVLAEHATQLEQAVAERTADLEEQTSRLRALAVELGSAENRERKRLAAMLHDDLQQLLTAASMQLSSLSHQFKGESAGEKVQKVEKYLNEATRASRDLTRQLRPPALYESGLVAALEWLASEMHERHGLPVALDASEDLAQWLNDDTRAMLFECVRELLFNAVKHAHAGEATVSVREDEGRLHLAVDDNGRGFDPEIINEKSQKSGFGLFRLRERMTALDGTLTIESTPGEGTRVELTVPRTRAISVGDSAASPVAEKLRSGKIPDNARAADDGRFRVLVVDDHALVRQGIANIIGSDARMTVIGEAADGVAAIEAVERDAPEVVLMDVNMPRKNGIEATREIHRRWPDIIVVGLSVQTDDVTARSMVDAGAAAFIAKAGNSEEMIALIVRLLEDRAKSDTDETD